MLFCALSAYLKLFLFQEQGSYGHFQSGSNLNVPTGKTWSSSFLSHALAPGYTLSLGYAITGGHTLPHSPLSYTIAPGILFTALQFNQLLETVSSLDPELHWRLELQQSLSQLASAPTGNQDVLWNKLCTQTLFMFICLAGLRQAHCRPGGLEPLQLLQAFTSQMPGPQGQTAIPHFKHGL